MTTDSYDQLEANLQTLTRRWAGLTEAPPEPRTLMDVIEYGLGNQRRGEVYVNRLLCYLLDPDESHGMDTDFLAAVLDGLPDVCRFDEDTYDLSDVRVNQQVPIRATADEDDGDDATPGYADLVLDVPNEWVLLVELKFGAAETGTEFYSDAEQFGDQPVADYGSEYCVYLHRQDRPEASAEEFVNWTWESFVTDVLEPFTASNAPRYPQRTVTQLHDLDADLRNLAGMTDQSDTDQEKIGLYLEHQAAVDDVRSAFDTALERYGQEWGTRLAERLAEGTPSVTRASEGPYPQIMIEREDRPNEQWVFRDNGGDWQHVFKHGWWQLEDRDDTLKDRERGSDLRVGFYHRLENNRTTAVSDHELEFNYRCMGSNPSEFSDIHKERFEARQSEIEKHLADTHGELTGNKLTMIRTTYDIPVAEPERFFEAYTAALETAFTDLVIENPELVRVLGEVFEESLNAYR